jgi:hypothetical protein
MLCPGLDQVSHGVAWAKHGGDGVIATGLAGEPAGGVESEVSADGDEAFYGGGVRDCVEGAP